MQRVGDVYIALLQMTVLPYVTIALITHIGGLDPAHARRLALRSGLVLLALWGLGLITVVLFSFALPEWETGSFFSTSLLATPRSVDLIDLYIPTNPFRSLADSVVPAVVVFSTALGVALIGVGDKHRVLVPLAVVLNGLSRINTFIAKLTPLGVFALTASAAGTLTLAEVGRLQGYLISYLAGAVLLTVWILPAFVSAFTPFTHREVLGAAKDAVITALATDSLFIVLPLLIRGAGELSARRGLDDEQASPAIDVVIPIGFALPHLGKLLSLLFIPFAAWFSGRPMTLGEFPAFLLAGLSSFFAKATIAIPFLLDLQRLPADLFRLFLLAGLLVARFGSSVAAMNLFCFALMSASAMAGRIAPRPRLVVAGLTSAALLLLAVGGTRAHLGRWIEGAADKESILAGMQLLRSRVPARLVTPPAANPTPLRAGQSRLSRLRERGVIRVGFDPDMLPFAFFNSRGELVGFDIELAHALARDLDVTLEFVAIRRRDVKLHLDQDHVDLVMSGLAATAGRFADLRFSAPQIELTPALVVPDHRRHEFASRGAFLSRERSVIGISFDDLHLHEWLRARLPNAELVPIVSFGEFFEGAHPQVEAVVISAEGGSAWTLRHPDYQVVVPFADVAPLPAGYPVAGGDLELVAYLDSWLRLQRATGVIDRAYDHWILGRVTAAERRRWSVLHDVLGWDD